MKKNLCKKVAEKRKKSQYDTEKRRVILICQNVLVLTFF